MKILVLLPGKIKPKSLLPAEEEYKKRLQHFGVEVVEYRDEKIYPNQLNSTRKIEATRILQRIKPKDFLVACDERGKLIQTNQLVTFLNDSQTFSSLFSGKERIVVVIGGALGLDEQIRKRADAVWALSSLVMAGGVARIVLLEGLYRAFTILHHFPYHNP